jgi:hypothetical protein
MPDVKDLVVVVGLAFEKRYCSFRLIDLLRKGFVDLVETRFVD